MVTISLHSLEKLTTLCGKQGNLYQVPGTSRKSQHSRAPVRAGVDRKSFTQMNPSILSDSVSPFVLDDCY